MLDAEQQPTTCLDIELHGRLVQNDVVLCHCKVMHQVCRSDCIHRVFPQKVSMPVETSYADQRLLQQVIVEIP